MKLKSIFSEDSIFSRLIETRIGLISVVIMVVICLVALFAPLLSPYSPSYYNVYDRLTPPSAEHWFGTNGMGRDVLSRLIYGARISLMVGFLSVLFASIFGILIGLFSAFYKKLDNLLMRVVDGIMAFPPIILALAIMAVLGANLLNVIVTLGVVYTPRIARVIRSSALTIRELPYIEACRSYGAQDWRIIGFHILPNSLSPYIVTATYLFAQAIMTEAILSFLGVGVPPEVSSWGNLLAEGRSYLFTAPWLSIFPGIAISITILALNIAGDRFRDAVDPTLLKTR